MKVHADGRRASAGGERKRAVARTGVDGRGGEGSTRPSALSDLQAMANAAPATQRLSALQRLAESHTPPAQLRQTISGRQRLSRLARDAIRLIQQSGPAGNNATLAEVQAHDRAMSPGQHHAMRIVRRSDLIRDLVTRRGQHAQNNIRDSTAMNAAERAGNNVLAAQLAAEKTRAPEQ